MTTPSLASATDLDDLGYTILARDRSEDQVNRILARASRAIESRCSRRFAPFTVTESHRADGIDPAAVETGGWPLDLIAALGQSKARGYAITNLVRDVWLNEYAPLYPDQWSYTGVSVTLARPYGDTENVLGSSLEGPEPDTGHFRFRLGTFIPVGTTVRVTYSGGYTTTPDDLVQATVMQAAKHLLLGAEPQMRKDMNLDELNTAISDLLCPYTRS